MKFLRKKTRIISFFVFLVLSLCNIAYPMVSSESVPVDTAEVVIDIEALHKEQLSDWKSIKSLYISSLQEEKEENKKIQNEEIDENDPSVNLEKAFSSLTEKEKLEVAFSIFEEQDKSNSTTEQNSNIVDDTTFRDLVVFCGNQESPENNFVQRTDNTYTISGKLSYLNILYHPVEDVNKLTKRQDGIKKLVKNQELYDLIKEKLSKLSQAETRLLSYFNEASKSTIDSVLRSQYTQEVFPKLPNLPNIPTCGFSSLKSINEFVDSYVNSYSKQANVWIKKKDKSVAEKSNLSANWLEARRAFDLVMNPVMFLMFFPVQFSRNLINLIIDNPIILIHSSNPERLAFRALVYSSIYFLPYKYKIILLKGYLGAEMAKEAHQKYKGLKYSENIRSVLHKVMNDIVLVTKTAQELKEIVEKNPEIKDALNIDNELQDYYEHDKKADNLTSCFGDKYFESEPRLLERKGKALAAFSKFKKVKDKLISDYRFIGKVDALLSIATLYKKHEKKNARFHFANYIEQDNSFIDLQGFWSPFIDPEKVVLNSIRLGNLDSSTVNNPRFIILTGPNAGGKSTSLTSVALSALCAQTLTITPGFVTLKPFKRIITLLNIQDTAGVESLFQAHQRRVKEVFEILSTVNPQDSVLIVPDELYNSTAEDVATALAYGTYKTLATQYPGTILFGATHFAKLSTLSSDPEVKGIVKNWKIEEAIFDENENPVWNHKIRPGVNKQNIALSLVRKDVLNHDVAKEAKKAYKQLYGR